MTQNEVVRLYQDVRDVAEAIDAMAAQLELLALRVKTVPGLPRCACAAHVQSAHLHVYIAVRRLRLKAAPVLAAFAETLAERAVSP